LQGGDDSDCAKVADDSIREVERACTTLQNEVDRRAKGNQVCCAAGKKAACHAKWRMDKAGNLVKNCKKAVKDAAAVGITGAVTLEQFEQLERKSSCLSSIKDNSNYAQVAAALKKEKRECEEEMGAKKALKKSYDDFVKDSDKQRKKCHDKSVKSAKEAFKQAKKACESDANKKASCTLLSPFPPPTPSSCTPSPAGLRPCHAHEVRPCGDQSQGLQESQESDSEGDQDDGCEGLLQACLLELPGSDSGTDSKADWNPDS
jgi:hypothetical protein